MAVGSRLEVAAQAKHAAAAAARRAGVTVRVVDSMDELRSVSRLLESVWGRSPEGVPLCSEVMRSLVHAGGCITAASRDRSLVGAAALTVAAPAGSTYSLIAAAAPGAGDHGIGYAVKLHQRAWALAHGYRTMAWTFDPLVSRNARFNLVKLGAEARQYKARFYGRMDDDINGDDDADRLVATWALDSRRAVHAAEGTADEPAGPDDAGEVERAGPDRRPMVVVDAAGTWCRVPGDVVALRRTDPRQASQWRFAVREVMLPALAAGSVAGYVTRSGWYLLAPGGAG
jgi:predicted GNAT superfamily acetyltransferase